MKTISQPINQSVLNSVSKMRRLTETSIELYVEGNHGIKYMKIHKDTPETDILQKEKEMIRGVTHGYKDKISLKGVGYRAQIGESKLELSLGNKLPVVVNIPSDITIKIKGSGTIVEGWSASKSTLRQFLSTIVLIKPASRDKYNGKGIVSGW